MYEKGPNHYGCITTQQGPSIAVDQIRNRVFTQFQYHEYHHGFCPPSVRQYTEPNTTKRRRGNDNLNQEDTKRRAEECDKELFEELDELERASQQHVEKGPTRSRTDILAPTEPGVRVFQEGELLQVELALKSPKINKLCEDKMNDMLKYVKQNDKVDVHQKDDFENSDFVTMYFEMDNDILRRSLISDIHEKASLDASVEKYLPRLTAGCAGRAAALARCHVNHKQGFILPKVKKKEFEFESIIDHYQKFLSTIDLGPDKAVDKGIYKQLIEFFAFRRLLDFIGSKGLCQPTKCPDNIDNVVLYLEELNFTSLMFQKLGKEDEIHADIFGTDLVLSDECEPTIHFKGRGNIPGNLDLKLWKLTRVPTTYTRRGLIANAKTWIAKFTTVLTKFKESHLKYFEVDPHDTHELLVQRFIKGFEKINTNLRKVQPTVSFSQEFEWKIKSLRISSFPCIKELMKFLINLVLGELDRIWTDVFNMFLKVISSYGVV